MLKQVLPFLCRESGTTMLQDWKRLTWEDLQFELPKGSKLVLRHNKHLQYGYTPKDGETLQAALQMMQEYCKANPKGNPKITGLIKVVEHTKLNNAPLWVKLSQRLRNQQ
jgi:hypothetical protein